MREWYGRARNSALLRAVMVMIGGTASAQIIAAAFVPLITRFYGPEDFGLYGSFNSLVGMIAPFAALSFPLAIILPRHDRDALGLVKLSLLIGAAVSLLALAVTLIWGGWLIERFQLGPLEWLIYLLGPALFFSVCLSVVDRWVLRKKLFGLSARADAAHSLVQHGAMAGFGAVLASGLTLVAVALASTVFQFLYLLQGALRLRRATQGDGPADDPAEADTTASATGLAHLRALAREYRDFALYKTPQNLVGAISFGITVPMIALGFGPAAAGYYTLARIVLGVPSLIVGGPVGSAFTPHFNQAVLDGRPTREMLVRTTGWLLLVSIGAFGAIALGGPWAFALLFGSEWDVAGQYVRWLALWHCLILANRAAHAAIQVLRLQGWYLIYEIVTLCARVTVLSVGIWVLADDMATVMLLSLTGAALSFVPISLALWGSGRLDRSRAQAAETP